MITPIIETIFASMERIYTSREIMQILNICENTLISYEKKGLITPCFRLGNRKRYYESSVIKLLSRLKKVG
jgi:DNA-binding transcriptional MerR regulator